MSSRARLAHPVRWLRQLDPDGQIVLLLLAISLVRGVLYALLNPPFGSPDEIAHHLYVASYYRSGGAIVEGAESHQPPLYYWLSLPLYALAATRSPVWELLAMRLMSVLMTAGTVLLAYWTARIVLPKDRLVCLGTAAFVALVPSYGWIGASANNDNLAKLATAGMICLLVYSFSRGFTRGRLLGLLGLVGVGLGAKATSWPVVAVVFLALISRGVWLVFRRRRAAALISSLVLAPVVVVALAGPVRPVIASVLGNFGVGGNFLTADRFAAFLSRLDAWPFVYEFKTFWVTFSSDTVQPPSPLYWVLAALCAASLAGLGVRLATGVRAAARDAGLPTASRTFLLQILALGTAVLLQWLLSLLYFYRANPLRPLDRPAGFDEAFWALQGRFLFPAMVPIGFLFLWGLRVFVPERWTGRATAATVLLLLAVDWISLGTLVLGYYAWPR